MPLSDRARRVLAACCCAVDDDGTILATIEEMSLLSGVSPSTVSRALGELGEAGQVHTSGRTVGTFRYVDASLLSSLRVPVSRRTHDDGWRELRARTGGLKRALTAAQRARDALRVAYEDTLTELQEARLSGPSRLSERFAWLRTEATHAVRCFDTECDRCLELDRMLDDDADDADIDDAAQAAFDEHEELRAAALEVAAAAKDRGVGARARQAEAVATLERVL